MGETTDGPVPITVANLAVPTATPPPPKPPIVNGMFSFASWDALFAAMDQLAQSQQDYLDAPAVLEPQRSASTISNSSSGSGAGP